MLRVRLNLYFFSWTFDPYCRAVDLSFGGCDKARPICDWILGGDKWNVIELRRWEYKQSEDLDVKQPSPATFWAVLKPIANAASDPPRRAD